MEEEVGDQTSEKKIDITISPNPTNGKVNIHFLPDSGMLSSEIYDILGQKIYNNSTQEEKGNTKKLNIQNIAATSGIYFPLQ
ncbi:MAG: T9SS type A sorting domain-containing protein [Ignavibacteriales bacterium]|nr:T9SS type A sorting domain-containing protein [Ignavibacteriales bacterium]